MSIAISHSLDTVKNGALESVKQIIPVPFNDGIVNKGNDHIHIEFGVLLGFTGDVKGKIIFKGQTELFSSFGEVMFGMTLEGDMLKSFAGELGNMVSGGLCTQVSNSGLIIDITAPSILEGHSTLSGYKEAVEIELIFFEKHSFTICILLD